MVLRHEQLHGIGRAVRSRAAVVHTVHHDARHGLFHKRQLREVEAGAHNVKLQRSIGRGFQVHVVDNQILVGAEAARGGHGYRAGAVHIVYRQPERAGRSSARRHPHRDAVEAGAQHVHRVFQPLAGGRVAHVGVAAVAVFGIHALGGAGHGGVGGGAPVGRVRVVVGHAFAAIVVLHGPHHARNHGNGAGVGRANAGTHLHVVRLRDGDGRVRVHQRHGHGGAAGAGVGHGRRVFAGAGGRRGARPKIPAYRRELAQHRGRVRHRFGGHAGKSFVGREAGQRERLAGVEVGRRQRLLRVLQGIHDFAR